MTDKRTLTLALKGIYFDQIKSGEKVEEFRLTTPYWTSRLEGRDYDRIILTRGYPPRGDTSRRLEIPWRGCRKTIITHPHFGDDPVEVYAIRVSEKHTAAGNPPSSSDPDVKANKPQDHTGDGDYPADTSATIFCGLGLRPLSS